MECPSFIHLSNFLRSFMFALSENNRRFRISFQLIIFCFVDRINGVLFRKENFLGLSLTEEDSSCLTSLWRSVLNSCWNKRNILSQWTPSYPTLPSLTHVLLSLENWELCFRKRKISSKRDLSTF